MPGPLLAAGVQFVLAHPAVPSEPLGMRSTAEGERNAALLEVDLPGTLWATLHGEEFARDAPVRFGVPA